MARGKKASSAPAGINPNAWMVTFGDLIMLLLTFFVMLLCMKSMDSGALKERFQELAATTGPLDYTDVMPGGSIIRGENIPKNAMVITNNRMLEDLLDLLEGVNREKAAEHHLRELDEAIDFREDERGAVIVMECDRLFESGKAEVRPDRLKILDAIGFLFRHVKNDILVVGHTDRRPIHGGPFASNLELSAYRALSVVFYLTEGLGLRAQRFAAGGFGDMQPAFPEETEEGRARNRRVEFILKKP
ncbi:MAG: hypothetical protein C4530_04355 [Desulfobacteraceae bacterium]|nr:MAG: hypothetical protein C4530_04355 [Desulfobacteraceae bacterium]